MAEAAQTGTARATTARATRRKPMISRLSAFAYLLVAPAILLIVGLVGYPFLYAIWVSFTDQVVGNVGKWIGFANFAYIFQSASFTASIVTCMLSSQLRQSNTRNTSMPFAAASWTKRFTTLSG